MPDEAIGTRDAPLVVVVLARNEAGSIARMLESVVRQTLWRATPPADRRLVVAANGCDDDTEERAIAWARGRPDVRVVSYPDRGKARTWNRIRDDLPHGADLWFFADADVLLHRRALERMRDAACAHPEAMVVSARHVSSARMVPPDCRGCLEAARIESERVRTPRPMVSGRLYAIRPGAARKISLPEGILNEDLYLSRVIGSGQIVRAPGAVVFAREPRALRDIVRYQVRTRIGSFQAKALTQDRVPSNRDVRSVARRTADYRRLSWRALVGKLLWLPVRLWVEARARHLYRGMGNGEYWIQVDSAKLQPTRRK